MSSKNKKLSLAEKISNLVNVAPTSFGSDDESEETKAKVVEYDESDINDDHETQYKSSKIRKKNLQLLEETDKRYKATKVSSKAIFNQDDSLESDLSDEDDNGINENNEESLDESDEDDELRDETKEESDENESADNDSDKSFDNDSDEEESDVDDDLDDIDLSNPLRRNRSDDNAIQTISATNVRAEIEKGMCVREQLKLWENLLEMRIKIQKCVINSNKLPQHDVYKNYELDDEFKNCCDDMKMKLSGLLNNLLKLQSNLINNFPETKNILLKDKKRKANDKENDLNEKDDDMDEEIDSDTEDEIQGSGKEESDNEEESNDEEESKKSHNQDSNEPQRKKMKLSDFENIISKNHKSYSEYRNSVIQKWNDKTRIASGVIKKGINQPVLKQIEFALANKDKMLKKTQLKRSEYDIIGKSSVSLEETDGRRTQEYNTEIYDDDDFYHQLLRELIEYKSADITDPIQLSKQWIQLQNMRSKMKRKIDTRATKGRRIRYNVHQKLVNFMAPITAFDSWTDHAKNELYSSLFRKMKTTTEETNVIS